MTDLFISFLKVNSIAYLFKIKIPQFYLYDLRAKYSLNHPEHSRKQVLYYTLLSFRINIKIAKHKITKSIKKVNKQI